MKITKADIKILVDLFKSANGLTAYVFYQRYKYGPSIVFKTVSKFEEKKYILAKDDKLFLTQEGINFVIKNRFVFAKNKFDRIPEEYLSPRIAVNEPYIPNYKNVSKEILNLETKGDG